MAKNNKLMEKNYKLSILMPAIRVDLWKNVYDSIKTTTKESFELIIVSPYSLPKELEEHKNIKFVRDYGNPNRTFNIALTLAEGEYTTWAPDDAIYQPQVLDKAIYVLDKLKHKEKVIISLSTIEAARHYSEDFLYINKHKEIKSKYIPDNYRFLACGVLNTEYFKKLGGVNCEFETHAMAHTDLAIRAQDDGATIIFLPDIAMRLTHMPGTTGDHGPIHNAQIDHDQPLYRKIYENPDREKVCHLDLFEWTRTEPVWNRRF